MKEKAQNLLKEIRSIQDLIDEIKSVNKDDRRLPGLRQKVLDMLHLADREVFLES